jgi:branched-chain amino acid transport system ATP-binding protein
VFENLVTAAAFGGNQAEHEAWHTAVDVLQKTGLKAHANKPAGGLTLLNRKRLELARALATRPKLLLLDEIAGGLTEHEAKELVDELKRIKAEGVTMIWIEHVVHALLAIADRLFVINFGQKLAEGEPQAVMNNPDVKRVYMGMEV